MRLFLLISVLVGSASAQCPFCAGVCVFDKYQNLRLLKSGLTKVIDMAYSSLLDTVFFTYDDFNYPPVRRLGYVKLADGETSYIEGIDQPHGITINLNAHIMYVSSPAGLYKLSLYSAVLKPVLIGPGIEMTSIFYYMDHVYFTTDKRIPHKFELDRQVVMPAVELDQCKVDKLVVDKHKNILYIDSQDDCVYRVIEFFNHRMKLPDTERVTDIAIDIYSNAYVAKPDGIYKYNGLTDDITFMGDNLENVLKMTFQAENKPIFNVNDKILAFNRKREPHAVHVEF